MPEEIDPLLLNYMTDIIAYGKPKKETEKQILEKYGTTDIAGKLKEYVTLLNLLKIGKHYYIVGFNETEKLEKFLNIKDDSRLLLQKFFNKIEELGFHLSTKRININDFADIELEIKYVNSSTYNDTLVFSFNYKIEVHSKHKDIEHTVFDENVKFTGKDAESVLRDALDYIKKIESYIEATKNLGEQLILKAIYNAEVENSINNKLKIPIIPEINKEFWSHYSTVLVDNISLFRPLIVSSNITLEGDDITVFGVPLLKTIEKYEKENADKVKASILKALDNALKERMSNIVDFLVEKGAKISTIEKILVALIADSEMSESTGADLLNKVKIEIGGKKLFDYLSPKAKALVSKHFALIAKNAVELYDRQDLIKYLIPQTCDGNPLHLVNCTYLVSKYLPNIIGLDKPILNQDGSLKVGRYKIFVSKLNYNGVSFFVIDKDKQYEIKAYKIADAIKKLSENSEELKEESA